MESLSFALRKIQVAIRLIYDNWEYCLSPVNLLSHNEMTPRMSQFLSFTSVTFEGPHSVHWRSEV